MEKRSEGIFSPADEVSGAGDGGEEEESGWTDYLEGFSSESDRKSSFCSSVGSSSSVSDVDLFVLPCSSVVDSSKKLVFKKTRREMIFQDDSLEDTATSPVHSPKVADSRVKPAVVNPRFDHMMISSSPDGERAISENYYSETGKDIGCEELKKRGLCLFPLSMLLNYHA